MEVVHERCAGLDVHKAEVVACVRVGTGRRVQRVRERFPTTTRGLLDLADWLAGHGCRVAALEATGVYWKPVWHVLEATVDLLLANPAHVRAIPGRKSDMNDAMWLADLMAHGLIRGSFVPPPAIQEIRDLTRTRKQLVRQVAQHTLAAPEDAGGREHQGCGCGQRPAGGEWAGAAPRTHRRRDGPEPAAGADDWALAGRS